MPPLHPAALLELAVALGLYVQLLAHLRQAEADPPAWWFGYARDGVNTLTVLLVWGGYLALGLPAAAAFLASALTTLFVYVLDWAVGHALELSWARLALLIPLVLFLVGLALAPHAFENALQQLVRSAQPLKT